MNDHPATDRACRACVSAREIRRCPSSGRKVSEEAGPPVFLIRHRDAPDVGLFPCLAQGAGASTVDPHGLRVRTLPL